MQPTNVLISDVTTYKLTVSFSPVDSVDGYLVLRKEGGAPTGLPVDVLLIKEEI